MESPYIYKINRNHYHRNLILISITQTEVMHCGMVIKYSITEGIKPVKPISMCAESVIPLRTELTHVLGQRVGPAITQVIDLMLVLPTLLIEARTGRPTGGVEPGDLYRPPVWRKSVDQPKMS